MESIPSKPYRNNLNLFRFDPIKCNQLSKLAARNLFSQSSLKRKHSESFPLQNDPISPISPIFPISPSLDSSPSLVSLFLPISPVSPISSVSSVSPISPVSSISISQSLPSDFT